MNKNLFHSKRFCEDEKKLDGNNGAFNNPNWMSENQKLVGKPNPKTIINPVIAPPIADLEYWKNNNMIIHSSINDETNTDVYNSGYVVTENNYNTNIPKELKNSLPYIKIQEETVENSKETYIPQKEQNIPYIKTDKTKVYDMVSSDSIDVSRGYNPEQLINLNLPSNLPTGNCQQNPAMKDYNKEIFTQNIQPDVYTTNNIIEPINSNIGISFTQQIPPTTKYTDQSSGIVEYIEHDPILFEKQPIEIQNNLLTEENVYDPRHTGYGTNYRAYTEEVTGQPRFYYDDINSIRMPNYIVRSKIDTHSYADQYGPIKENNEYGNPYTNNIHSLVNNSFLKSSIEHRTDIQQTAMRKVNAMKWQQRQAPINKNNVRMLGSVGCTNR